MTATFDEWCETQKASIAGTLSECDPKDDLLPILALYDGERTRIAGIPSLGEPDHKDYLAKVVIPEFIKQAGAYMGALAFTGWCVDKNNDSNWRRPSLDPARREVILLTCFKRDEERSFIGELERPENAPPRVTEWMPGAPNCGLFAGFGRYTL